MARLAPVAARFTAYLQLRSVDPARDRDRSYTITWCPALFEGGALVRTWGRTGSAEHTRSNHYPDRTAAQAHIEEILRVRLRQLKLSGMRDAIEARVEEARARGLDPLEFLTLLIDDELARRDTEGVERRIRKARFDEVCDLRDFDWSYNPEIPKGRIWDLASGRFIEEHASVLLCGPTGVGKSFIAQALGLEACRYGRNVLFVKTTAVLTDLAGGHADSGYQARVRRYVSPGVLILDDFAMREYTVVQTEDLYELVSRRHRRGSVIVTTNREPADLYALFPNPVLAEGLLDRLLNSAHTITLLGRSYRRRQRPGSTGVEAR